MGKDHVLFLIRFLMTKAVNFKLTTKNAHICALLLDMLVEIQSRNIEMVELEWESTVDFYLTFYGENFKNSFGLEILEEKKEGLERLAESKRLSRYRQNI